MWVMTFDGKNILDAGAFRITRNIGGKADGKYAIQGFYSASELGGCVCGLYPDEERAAAELERILTAVEEGVKVYRFSR